MKKPWALVLGGHGFVGRHTCRELATRGYKVISLGHGEWHSSESNEWGISDWAHGDIDLPNIVKAVNGRQIEFAIHCAGSGAVSNSYLRPHEDFERSVSTTAALLEFVRAHASATPRIVVASSAAVYGDQGDVDLTETSHGAPVSPYGVHKVLAESLCDSYHRFFGIRISVVRLFSVYGEGLRKQLLWDAAQKLQTAEPLFFGSGNEVRDWIHVEDAVRLLCAAAEQRDQSGFEIYNGGGAQASTNYVITKLAVNMKSLTAPRFTGTIHTGNPRRLTADNGNAHRLLGWAPSIGLDIGILRYANWFLSAGEKR